MQVSKPAISTLLPFVVVVGNKCALVIRSQVIKQRLKGDVNTEQGEGTDSGYKWQRLMQLNARQREMQILVTNTLFWRDGGIGRR